MANEAISFVRCRTLESLSTSKYRTSCRVPSLHCSPDAVFPGLYFHMFGQRKKQLSPAAKPPTASQEGIQFPLNSKGERSTTATGQVILSTGLACRLSATFVPAGSTRQI